VPIQDPFKRVEGLKITGKTPQDEGKKENELFPCYNDNRGIPVDRRVFPKGTKKAHRRKNLVHKNYRGAITGRIYLRKTGKGGGGEERPVSQLSCQKKKKRGKREKSKPSQEKKTEAWKGAKNRPISRYGKKKGTVRRGEKP